MLIPLAIPEYRNGVTNVAILVLLTILRQSRRDPVIPGLRIRQSRNPNPGIENSSPGLQSLAAVSSISLKFATEFDHVTADTLQAFKVKGS